METCISRLLRREIWEKVDDYGEMLRLGIRVSMRDIEDRVEFGVGYKPVISVNSVVDIPICTSTLIKAVISKVFAGIADVSIDEEVIISEESGLEWIFFEVVGIRTAKELKTLLRVFNLWDGD